MYQQGNDLIFSPSDLTLYMESPFASWMQHLESCYPQQVPEKDPEDGMMGLLQDKGEKHELAVLDDLRSKGLAIADISALEDKPQATLDAMRQGVDVIFQGALKSFPFKGYSDFLVKVPGKSKLGDYHYEVWDTKLSKTLKPYFVIQLCCYQDMLQTIQGRYSDEFAIVLGDLRQERLKTTDYFYYYLSLKSSFLEAHNSFDPAKQPDPAESKSWGNWANYAKQILIESDHLSQTATISRSQIKKLNAESINTMQQLADCTLDRVPGINQPVFQRLKAQAAIQKKSEGHETPLYQVITPSIGQKQGLALLPPHSDLDVFFDIEGYPLVDGGLEYLWGNTYFDENGVRQFKDFWAHNPEQEKQCFQDFIHWVYDRWQRDPSMHIYHYANYEIAACRKLMSRYGVCEHEVDQLLRNEVFVDLYKVVKGGLLIGEPKYSIKNVEHLYRGKRETEVGTGGDSVVVYENWRENPDGDTWQTSKILNDIRDYNIDDCDSTQELVDWLRDRQKETGIQFTGSTEVVEPDIPEAITERTQLRDKLLRQSESLADTDNLAASITENFAWSLEFHRRENKPIFWRLFDRLGLTDIELIDDLDCLACCERTDREPYKLTPRKKKQAFEYRFNPNQECKLSNKEYYVLGAENENGKRIKVTLVKGDSQLSEGLIVLEAMEEPPRVITLIPDEYVRPDPIPAAIEAVVTNFDQNKLGDCAIVDFLKRATPRINGITPGESIAPSHDPEERLSQVIAAIKNLDNSYLPIQGPPGAGKTFTGKHVIAELLKAGMKIGISSNSHKAINNLLIGTASYCRKNGVEAVFACTKHTDPAIDELDISVLKNADLANHLDQPCVIGTTAWGFAKDDLEGQFDYLFIDEAGQVSIANLIAMSRSANNIILMGDQMQLGQPAQGTHPAESGLSTLDYLLHDKPTISDDMGVFLGTTYRMHSSVNKFISEAIYEGKLESHPDNDKQIISVPNGYKGPLDKEAGIVSLFVEHDGNTQASDEEVEAIRDATKQLLGRVFTDKDGNTRPITWSDILYVSPYNHQVNKLKEALGDQAQIGSVDKFQGQEAPIVFLSMCASDAGDSPRGLDFLFDKHRINVAVSRAQSLAVIVSSPKLIRSDTSSISQQEKVNVFCRLVKGL